MKRLLFGFILGVGLSNVHGVKAQDVVLQGTANLVVEIQANHQHDLTVKEIVEILAEVDVRHGAQQPFFPPAYGATSFGVDPHVMWIFDTGDTASKRSTVLHELTHIHCHNAGVECPEEYVNAEEVRQYQKLFGAQ